MDLGEAEDKNGMNGTNTGLCPMEGFNVTCDKPLGPDTKMLAE
jgi:hypothetical protein